MVKLTNVRERSERKKPDILALIKLRKTDRPEFVKQVKAVIAAAENETTKAFWREMIAGFEGAKDE